LTRLNPDTAFYMVGEGGAKSWGVARALLIKAAKNPYASYVRGNL